MEIPFPGGGGYRIPSFLSSAGLVAKRSKCTLNTPTQEVPGFKQQESIMEPVLGHCEDSHSICCIPQLWWFIAPD